MRFFVALAAVAIAHASASSAAGDRVYVEHEKAAHGGHLAKRDVAPRSIVLPMRIGLTQSNLHKGHDMLMEISKHGSPNFGKHYTAEEVHDIFAPSLMAVKAVKDWIESAGIASHRISQSFNRQWLQFDASISEVEALLRTEYHVYDHGEDPEIKSITTDCYHVPEDIQEHIDYITPGVRPVKIALTKRARKSKRLSLRDAAGGDVGAADSGQYIGGPRLHPLTTLSQQSLLALPSGDPATTSLSKTNDSFAACEAVITPNCVHELYEIGSRKAKPQEGNALGIYASSGYYYSQADMDKFYRTSASWIPKGTRPTPVSIDGAPFIDDISAHHGETNLDLQSSISITWPQKTILFDVDDQYYQENLTITTGYFNTFLEALDGSYCDYIDPNDPVYPDPNDSKGAYKGKLQCGAYKPTNVISISYSLSETTGGGTFFKQLPLKYQTRQCNEFMKLGLQGITLICSSSDFGISPKGEKCFGPKHTIFGTSFPSNCPYLTSVGATTLMPRGTNTTATIESAATQFSSGGGFSSIYATPEWQKKAVDQYLDKYAPKYPTFDTVNNKSFGANGGIFNRGGRGYPDVSALGQDILIIDSGASQLADGTSGSTPLFAAIITRINDERIGAGKKPIGFLNPIIYAHPEAFNDVIKGSNPGVAGRCNKLDGKGDSEGFTAAPGWDPLTGLGTPNYPKLLQVLLDAK